MLFYTIYIYIYIQTHNDLLEWLLLKRQKINTGEDLGKRNPCPL